jgi:apolipoprotein N-acyltransferase
MPGAVAHYFAQPWLVGFALFVVVAGGMAAPYYAAFAAVAPPLARGGGFAGPLAVGAAWAGAELLRGRLLNGDLLYVGSSTWATLGYSQSDVLPVVQVAALFGVYGISFVVATANAALAQAVTQRDPRGLLAAGAVILATLGYGFATLSGAPDAPTGTRLALVQPALDASGRWQVGGAARSLDTYLRLTRDALRDDPADLVVWPEAALPLFLEEEDLYRRGIDRMMSELGTGLVLGAMRRETGARERYWNSVFVLGEGGAIAARYDKIALLPFMEYFPSGIDLLRRRFGRLREFTPGDDAAPLPTRAGPAGVLVCNEAYLPHVARRRVADGARFLLNPSNDGWVLDAGFAAHQFQIASLRAVETRTALVRASDSGPSGVVDAWGRVTGRTAVSEAAVARAVLAPGPADAPYLFWGDVPVGAAALLALTWGALRARRARDAAR